MTETLKIDIFVDSLKISSNYFKEQAPKRKFNVLKKIF